MGRFPGDFRYFTWLPSQLRWYWPRAAPGCTASAGSVVERQHAPIVLIISPYTYYATATKVHDGNTFTVEVDLGMDLWHRNLNVRLNGCKASELREPGGKEAQANLAQRLPTGTVVLLRFTKFDEFGGRINAQVWQIDHAGQPLPGGNMTANLVAGGWAAA